MKTSSKHSFSLNSVLYNRVLLYIFLFISLVNMTVYGLMGDITTPLTFVLIGIITAYYNKNMLIILVISLTFSNILKYGSQLTINSKGIKEGMEDGTNTNENDGNDNMTNQDNNMKEDNPAPNNNNSGGGSNNNPSGNTTSNVNNSMGNSSSNSSGNSSGNISSNNTNFTSNNNPNNNSSGNNSSNNIPDFLIKNKGSTNFSTNTNTSSNKNKTSNNDEQFQKIVNSKDELIKALTEGQNKINEFKNKLSQLESYVNSNKESFFQR